MKKLLLTTALVAFAGVASVNSAETIDDLTTTGDTTLGSFVDDSVFVAGELIIYDEEGNPINLTEEFPALAATVAELLHATGRISRTDNGNTAVEGNLTVDSLTVNGNTTFYGGAAVRGGDLWVYNSNGGGWNVTNMISHLNDGVNDNYWAIDDLDTKVDVINTLLTSTFVTATNNESDLANQSSKVNSNFNKLRTVTTTADRQLYVEGNLTVRDTLTAGGVNITTKLTELETRLATLESSGVGGSGGLTEADVEAIVDEAVGDLEDTFNTRVGMAANDQSARDAGQDGAIGANEAAASAANAAATAAQEAADKAQADATANSGLIATNTANIATNADGIATNAGNIAENSENIATNAGNISANSDAIAGNSAAISVNAGNIAVNAQNIAVNAENIAVNAEDIADNTDRILVDASELTALLATVEALTAKVANLEEVDLDTADRIKTLAAENEELTAAALAMSNAGAIATLEEQWKTDPVLGNIELDGLTGKVMHIEVRTGVYEERVARVEDIQTIADRVADNTSRIQLIENAIFVEHKESALVRMMKKLHSDAR